MNFGLKNDSATFQIAMASSFHELAHIILAILDDLIHENGQTIYLMYASFSPIVACTTIT